MNLFRVRASSVRAAAYVAAVSVVASTLTRMAIAFRMETASPVSHPGEVFLAMVSGLISDLGVAVFLAAPVILFLEIPAGLWKRKYLRLLAHAVIAGGLFGILFGAVAEIFFWEEFSSRFNGIAVYYLMFPREVIGNIQESFNLSLYLPPVVAGGILLWWLFRHGFSSALDGPRAPKFRRHAFVAVIAACFVAVLVVKAAPAGVSHNREIRQLAANGLANMVAAALTNDAEYDGVYPGMEESEAIQVLRDIVAQDNTTFLHAATERSILRHVDNGTRPKTPNIVMVTEETFGSIYVDDLDNQTGAILTPNLTRLGKEGLYFTNIYASGDRTVRGLEATETAFAPIPGISTTRRPGSEGMYSLPSLLKGFGYTSGVLYGGQPIFDSMGAFWSGIGFDHVWGESDVRHESFTTIWGVSDEDLFTEALKRMDENVSEDKPFLLTLMTVSNHRPYKFPETHIKWDSKIGNRENTARYADWAFGDFIKRARTKPWFDNTVFIFVAGHSRKVNGAADVPMQSFRIPVLIYAPKLIQPARVDTLGAQIDLIPTLLGQLGISYDSPFFGIDLMRVPKGGGRAVVAHNFSIAYARPGHAVVLNPDGETRGYRFQPGLTPLVDEDPDPETLRQAIAQTQTAHRMFYSGQYHIPSPALAGGK